jgi:hypothetical protein
MSFLIFHLLQFDPLFIRFIRLFTEISLFIKIKINLSQTPPTDFVYLL